MSGNIGGNVKNICADLALGLAMILVSNQIEAGQVKESKSAKISVKTKKVKAKKTEQKKSSKKK